MYRQEHGFERSRTSSRGASRPANFVSVGAPLALLALLIGGCDTKSAPMTKPPAPQVTVAKVECKAVIESDEFTGRLEAGDHVEIRPSVSGPLDRVHFQEGGIAQKGEMRFTIDLRPDQVESERVKRVLA